MREISPITLTLPVSSMELEDVWGWGTQFEDQTQSGNHLNAAAPQTHPHLRPLLLENDSLDRSLDQPCSPLSSEENVYLGLLRWRHRAPPWRRS